MSQSESGVLPYQSSYRWVILGLVAVSGFVGIGFPTSSLPVLFNEIATSLHLDLVQIGFIWGVTSFMGIITSLVAGPMIDYIGVRRATIILCILLSLTGMLRGLATDFWTLFAFSFLFGIMQPVLPVCLIKIAYQWFSREQLGLANSIMSAGFAVGLLTGARFSATVLSPALGGWRVVVILTGALALVVGALWYFVHPREKRESGAPPNFHHIFEQVKVASRIPSMWIVGMIGFGIVGLMRGLVGYVPSYLREVGWSPTGADSALALFFLASLIGVVPIGLLSDRLRSRRLTMLLATSLITTGTLLMFFVDARQGSSLVYLAMFIGGIAFDGFMAIHNAAITEISGVGAVVSSTAIGFALMLRNVGGTFAPPAGNSLTPLTLNAPFLVWGLLGLMAVVLVFMYNEAASPKTKTDE